MNARAQATGGRFAFILVGLILVVVLLAFSGSWYTVDAGERAVVTRLGAVVRVTGPGLHFKTPFIETAQKVSTRVQAIEWTGDKALESYSKDQQPAHLAVKVVFRVNSDRKSVTDLYTNYRDSQGFVSSIIVPRTLEAVKTVFGQFNSVTVIQERAHFNTQIEKAVKKIIAGPVSIEGVQIQDIAFSDAYENAVEQRMQAQVAVEKMEQQKRQEQLQADIKVIQATADAQSVRLKGEAEAQAIRARGDALRDNPQLVSLVAAEKWNGSLPTTMVPGSAVPFVQMPAK